MQPQAKPRQLTNLSLKALFTEEELAEFIRAISKDKTIVPMLLKLIDSRNKEVGRKDDLLNDPNYPIKRAYLDGRSKELDWWKSLLTLT